jgi:hypothetical protein
MFSFFDIPSSLLQTVIISFLSLLNPWNVIEDDTKKKIVENTIISSINVLRSNNIETTYDDLEVNILNDFVSIKNLKFKYLFEEQGPGLFCEFVNKEFDNWEEFYGCPIEVNLDELLISGLFNANQNITKSKLIINNLHLDGKAFDYNSTSKAMKALLELDEGLSMDLKYELEYAHNQNAMILNFDFITDSYFDLNINTSVSRMNYNFDNPSMSRFSINDFQMIVKDLGIINKTNLMLDINNIAPINNLFLESITPLGYLKEDLESADQGSNLNFLYNIYNFLSNSGQFQCRNDGVIAMEGYYLEYFYDFESFVLISPIGKLCTKY